MSDPKIEVANAIVAHVTGEHGKPALIVTPEQSAKLAALVAADGSAEGLVVAGVPVVVTPSP